MPQECQPRSRRGEAGKEDLAPPTQAWVKVQDLRKCRTAKPGGACSRLPADLPTPFHTSQRSGPSLTPMHRPGKEDLAPPAQAWVKVQDLRNGRTAKPWRGELPLARRSTDAFPYEPALRPLPHARGSRGASGSEMWTQVCTCGAPRKYQTRCGPSSRQLSQTPSLPVSPDW